MHYTDSTSGTAHRRLVSLDALRGFDMFWIIGARAIADGLNQLKLPGVSLITRQLTHSAWNGFTFYDFIFPLFVFITGISLVLSLQKRLERGEDRGSILRHVITRTVTLFVLGIVYNGWIDHQSLLSSIRIMGVLQRTALCYLFGSLMVIYSKPRTQAVTVVAILVSYWAIMRFVPVPGFGAGVWTQQGNLARYIDSLLLPGRLYFGDWDPEGLLSTVPALATCLLGVLTGHWLRAGSTPDGETITPEMRAEYLFLGGLALVVLT
jgi:predicted acyltransferase